MPNKYEKVAEAGKIMPNKYQALAEPFKLMDKAIEDFNKSTDSMFSEITYVSRLESEVKQLKHIVKGYRFENTTLKKSLSKAGEMIEELKKKKARAMEILDKTDKARFDTMANYAELVNICSDDQIRELAYILKRNKEDNNKKENK